MSNNSTIKCIQRIDLKQYIREDMWEIIKDDGRIVSALSDGAIQLEGWSLEDGLLINEKAALVADFRLLTSRVDFRKSSYRGIGRQLDKKGQKEYAKSLDGVLVGSLNAQGVLEIYLVPATKVWILQGKTVVRNTFMKEVSNG